MSYGIRQCLICHTSFEASYAAQIVCSPECKYERRKESWRVTARKQADKRKAYVTGLEARVQELETQLDAALKDKAALQEEIDALKAELAALKLAGMAQAEPEPSPEPSPKPSPKQQDPVLHECKRMNLRAMRLPCGEREECTFPTPLRDAGREGRGQKVQGMWEVV